VLGFGKEIWEVALVELGLSNYTTLEKLLATLIEGSVEESEEDDGILIQDLARLVIELTEDVDILEDLVWVCCHCG